MKQSLTLTIKSVGFAPFMVRVREGIRVNRIIKITHVHNLHEKRLEFGPFMIPRKKKKRKLFSRKFSQTILRNLLGSTKSGIKLCFMQRQI